MNKPSLVSIIIPTYNRAHLIGDTLDSIIVQTYTNWECIIVDDGSTDDTEELLKSYTDKDSRFQYYKRSSYRIKGANACRNYGFELSKGEYVNWFDDDDLMDENFLFKKIDCFNVSSQMVICNGIISNSKNEFIRDIKFELENDLFEDYVLWNFQVLTPSVLFRKKFLENFKLFNTKILRGQETEFFSRVFYKLPLDNVKIIEDKLFSYRQHHNTKSNSNASYNPNYIESICIVSEKNFTRAENIGNKKIMISIVRNLMLYFFRSMHNKDFKNSKQLIDIIFKKYKKINIFKSLRFFFTFKILLIFKRSSYVVEKMIINNL